MVENFDTDSDGEISYDEALLITRIDVITDNISSVHGIEYCLNLQDLSCHGSSAHYDSTLGRFVSSGLLSSLDVSNNTALRRLECNDNQLTSLDVSNNNALRYLGCYSNQLTSLELPNNTALQTLECYSNQLTSLDVSKNTELAWLSCDSNQLTSLDVSKNTALTTLACDNNQLTGLDVSNNTALRYLGCYSNQLTSLDVSNNTVLLDLFCSFNQLTSLDVSNNTELAWLFCDDNQLTSLDVSDNTALTDLGCSYNQLTNLDVSNNTSLTYLYCDNYTMQYLFLAEGQEIPELYKNNNTEIVYKGAEPAKRFIACIGLDKVPFICNDFNLSSEISNTVLETLDMEYEEFLDLYGFKGIWGYKGVLSDDGLSVESQFVKLVETGNADEDIRLSFSEWYMKNGIPAQREKDFGTARYSLNNLGLGSGTFSWQVSPQDMGAGTSRDIYFCFESITGDIAYFIMRADVARPAYFDVGANKLNNEWYDDIDGEYLNTARINVLVPTKTGDVTDFHRDLNKFFVGYIPSLSLSTDSDPVYQNYFDNDSSNDDIYNPEDLEGSVEYFFASEQPRINGVQLRTNYLEGSDKLYAGSCTDDNLIATLDPEGMLVYNYAEGENVAKSLLNLWSFNVTDQSRMLYANVIARASYGACHIPGGDSQFHVRFLRPINVYLNAVDVDYASATIDGINIQIANFISGITDWNKQNVIVRNHNTGYYMANIIAGINIYQYYGISRLVLNLDNAERDNWNIADPNARAILKDVTPDASLDLGSVDPDSGVFVPGESNELDITDIANINGVVINYRNNRAIVETFNIYIPIAIEYAWGTLEDTFVIRIRSVMAD